MAFHLAIQVKEMSVQENTIPVGPHKDWECPICFTDFVENDPKVLTCGHTVCEACLSKLLPKKKIMSIDMIGCPFCKSLSMR